MGEENKVVHNFYPGIDYGLDPEHGSGVEYSENFSPTTPVGSLGITTDPRVANQYYTLAVTELSLNMAQGIGRTPDAACILDAKVCEGRPIMSCENTQGNAVIELVLGGERPMVELDGGCIKLSGSNAELVKAVDRLLYKWYKVMK